MLTTREYMEEARDFIAQKRYDEAREILVEIDHPLARKWLDKLDEIDPPLMDDPFAEAEEIEPIRPKRKSSTDKGELLGVFGLNVLEFIRRLVFGLGSAILLFGCLYMGFQPKLDSGLAVMAFGFGLIFFLAACYLLGSIGYYFLIDRKTLIYEHGVERKTRKGMQYYSFEDINAVQGYVMVFYMNGITTVIMGAHQFYHDDQTLFAVNGLDQRFYELAGYINHKLEETHKSRLLKEYRNGKTLSFKPVELRRDGLYHGKKHLPLEEMGGVEISGDGIIVRNKKGRAWKRYHISQICNPWLFESVVTTLTKR